MRSIRLLAIGVIMVACVGCGRRAPALVTLAHDAYVWQRAWTGAVADSVAAAPAEVGALRVLAVEIAANGGDAAWLAVDAAALARAGRPVIAVARIDGARPIAHLDLAPLLARLDRWRAAGVEVVGVEIDHDCATAALDDYAVWLARARPPAPLRWSITALPTWAGARALARVAAAVDELVVQVHAVQRPRLFDPGDARAWIARFARAVRDRPLRVALPTYTVKVGGEVLVASPAEVAAVLRGLERDPVPGVVGIVWFRLPVDGDRAAWPAATLRAVITGAPLAPRVGVTLDPRGGDRYDIVLANRGTVDAPYPPVRLAGAIAADLTRGYAAAPAGSWTAPARTLRAGERVVVGWATGRGVIVDVP
jgi:hypothetical protein